MAVSQTASDTTARRGPHAERRAATRAKIMAAAVHCLNTVGYAGTTTVQVAAEAGVARGSLLHQFPTRIDLILAVASHVALDQGSYIKSMQNVIPGARDRFISAVDASWAALKRPESRALIEIILATRHDPDLAERIGDFAQRYDAGIAAGARRLAESTGLAADADEATEERRFMLATLRGLAIEAALSGSAQNPEPILARLRASRARFYDAAAKASGNL
jgi:AcrR family transcriptional regulator